VQKMTVDMIMDFTDMPISEENLEELAGEFTAEYENKKGMEYKTDIKDSVLTVTMINTIKDMSKEDIEDNYDGVMDDDGNVKLEKVTADFEEEGLTKK
ncbi:hypothetical protein LJC13_04385, partial [Peptostreptococcaceae bacterium OttesenSCG-928-C18]|nr:hypothetical protein [Peptostreptococcaceae bacterium OttesenSCG-928-C18]